MIIGLLGAAGSGKSTVARFLREDHEFVELAFADPLKQAAEVIFGFTSDQLHGTTKEVPDQFWGFTPRWALQRLGTEAGRQVFGEDLWIRVLERRMRRLGSRVVISDVRFENEAQAVVRWGGMLVRVIRPASGVSYAEGRTHASETEAQTIVCQVEVHNTGGLADLRARVWDLIRDGK